MAGGRIDYTVGFKVDTTQLNTLKTQLAQLQTNVTQLYTQNAGKSIIDPTKAQSDIAQINASIGQMQTMFSNAFNSQLGTLNISKFNAELQKSKIPLSQIQADFSKLGVAGQNAFRSISAQMLTTNLQLKQSHTMLQSMADTLVNTFKWSIASSAINGVATGVRNAYDYSKKLDTSLNNIRIVTGKSAEDMDKFAKQANKAAKSLGASTTQYTDAALIYYQQGLSDKEAAARAEVTTKVANVTGQTGEEVSEQLTAVWNGYKVSAAEAETYIDKLAAVAASTASDLEELSVGMSKVASAANIVGVDIDQLNAQISTMVSVTRESAETIGTSLKTIYARMTDIESGMDDETTLGAYTESMANLGFNVLDSNKRLRDMGDIVEEIGGKWNTLSREQQVALAQTIGGTRQYSRLLSLFDNWDMYEKSLNTSKNSMGTLQEQQDIYMDSMEAHLKQLTAASEGLYSELMEPEKLNPLIDGLTKIVELLGSFTAIIGGGAGALQLLGIIAMKVFQKHIVAGLTKTILNFGAAKYNAEQLANEMQMIQNLEKDNNGQDARLNKLIQMKKTVLKYSESITAEDREALNQLIQQTEELYKQQDALKQKQAESSEFLQRRTGFNKNLEGDENIAAAQKELGTVDYQISVQEGNYKKLTAATNEAIVAKAEYDKLLKQSQGTDDAATRAKEQLAEAEKRSAAATKASNQEIEFAILGLEESIGRDHYSADAKKELTEAISAYRAAVNSTESAEVKEAAIKNAIIKLQAAMKKGTEEERAAYKKLEKDLSSLNSELKNNELAIKQSEMSFANFEKTMSTKNMVTNFTNGLNAASSFAMGLNSLANAFDAIKNPDLSGMEKFTQITMGLSMGLGMLISSIGGIVTLWKSANAALGAYITLQTMSNMATAYGVKMEKTDTVEDVKQNILQKIENELLKEKQRIIDEINRKEGRTGRKKKKLTNKHRAAAKKEAEERFNTEFNEKQVSKKDILGNKLKGGAQKVGDFLTSKAGWMKIGGFALIAAGVVAMKTAFDQAKKIINKNQIELDKATAAAERTAQAYTNVQEEYKKIIDTSSKYKDAVNGLDELSVGTSAYKEKMTEANNAALELISTLNLIKGQDYGISADGLISINDDALEAAKLKELEKVERARAVNLQAQQRKNDAQLEVNKEKFAREQLKDRTLSSDEGAAALSGAGGAVGGALITAGAFAAAGSTIPVIGTLIGAAVGLIVGGVVAAVNDKEGKATKKEYEALEAIAKESERRGDGSIYESGELKEFLESKGYSKELIESLTADIEATKEQTEAIRANTAQLKLTYQQMAAGANVDNEIYSKLSDKDKALADTLIGADRSEDIEDTKEYKKAEKEAKDMFSGQEKEFYEKYLEMMYGEDAKNYRVRNKAGTNATLQQYNEETKKWENVGDKNSLSNKDVIHQYAEMKALGMTEEDKKILDEINKAGNIVDSIKGVKTDVVESIKQSLANGDGSTDLSTLSPEQVQEIQNKMGELQDTLSRDYYKALESGLENYSEDKYYNQLANKINAKIEAQAAVLEIDKRALEGYAESLLATNKELENNKELAVDAAVANIKFAKGAEKLQEALNDNLDILNEWDENALETYEAAAKVQDALKEMFNVDVSAEFVKKNLNDIKAAAEGNVKAIDKLSILAAKDYTAQIVADDGRLAYINDMLDELANKDYSIGVTTDIDTSAGVDALNELLRSGAITEEQMNNMFSSIGYKPNVVMVGSGKFTSQEQKHTITKEGPFGIPITTKYTDKVISEIMVPQIVPEGQESADVSVIEKGGLGGSFTTISNSTDQVNAMGSLTDNQVKSKTQENAENMKYLDEERDVYHDINIELQKLENNLEKVQKAREKMVGGDIIDSYDEELKLLNKQIDAQKTKIEIAKLESQTLKETLQGQGVQFAEDGTVIGYNDILNQKEAEINALIKQYKTASNEKQQEDIQKQIDKKQEEYDLFKENLERYDEVTFNELAELEAEVADKISQKIEVNIEKFTKDINLKIDLNEFKKEWRNLQQNILFGEDNNFATFNNAIAGLQDVFGEDGGLLTDQLERTQTFLEEYNKIFEGGWSAIFEDSKAAALEAAREMHSMTMESAEQALEYINTLKDAIDASYEQIMSLHDSILDTFDRELSIIEHQIAVKNLLFGDSANLDTETEAKFELQLQKIESAKQKMEDAQTRANQILAGRDASELTGDDLYKWTEQQVEVSEAYETIFSTVEEALDTINTLLQQDIQDSIKWIESELTNNIGWNRLSERWEKDQELADVYLSGINKEYELQKLLNKINQDLLDKQYDSINAQKKINDFKNDELAILMQKDKLTQAELDRANKLYELTLLQIALDEARNNKSSMKLARDSQGNYVYQYTTDEDAVAKAEQALADKRNEIYRQNVENTTQAISDFNSLGQEMQDEIQGIFDNDKFQEYLGLMASGEGDSERAKELESWLYGAIDEITADYNYRMGAAQDNTIASLKYIFKDLGIENVDLKNLTDEQRQILLDEGINIQRLGTLLEFNEDELTQTLTSLDSQIQTMVDEYVDRVGNVTVATGNASVQDYYSVLDLIKLNTEESRNIYRKERDEEWVKFNEMQATFQEKIPDIQEALQSLVGENGLLTKNNQIITNALTGNENSVTSKIGEAITAINGVKQAVSTAMIKYNEVAAQIKENLTDANGGSSVEYNVDALKADGFSAGQAYKYKDSYWQVDSVDYGTGAVKLSNLVDPSKTATVNASQLNSSDYLGAVIAGGKGKDINAYDTKKTDGTGAVTTDTRAIVSKDGKTGYVINNKGELGTSDKWAQDAAKYHYSVNDRVKVGSGTGSESWKVTGYDGVKVKLTNMLTGESKNINYKDVDKNMKDAWVESGKFSATIKSSLIKELYEEGISVDKLFGYIWDKDGDWSYDKYKIYGLTKSGKTIVQRDSGEKEWVVTKDHAKKFEAGKITLQDLISLHTGGYTGAWFNGSKDGRLALLHQKELILNESDTPKILDAVKLVREISAGSIIADFEAQMKNTLASLENQLIGTYTNIESMAAAAKQSTDQMLEQAVHIDASFPGVKDAREIEEALNNLVNVASQYAYENNK